MPKKSHLVSGQNAALFLTLVEKLIARFNSTLLPYQKGKVIINDRKVGNFY